jgi:hypothetical protein
MCSQLTFLGEKNAISHNCGQQCFLAKLSTEAVTILVTTKAVLTVQIPYSCMALYKESVMA